MPKITLLNLALGLFLLVWICPANADNSQYSFDGFDLTDTPESVVEKAAGNPDFTVTSDIEAALTAIKRTGAKTLTVGSSVDKRRLLPPSANNVFLGSTISDILKDYRKARMSTLGGPPNSALTDLVNRLSVVQLYDGRLSEKFITLIEFVFYTGEDGTQKLMYIHGGGAGLFRDKIVAAYKKKYGKGKTESRKTPGRIYEAISWENAGSIASIKLQWGETADSFYIVDKKILANFADEYVKAAALMTSQEVEDRI